VGKVIASYPTASEVLLITDPDFAAGVISQKTLVRGTLKGQGNPMCKVDYVSPEEKLEPGDWLYTSGDDRIFPRGLPVGVVKAVRPGQPFQEILLEPSGMQRGLEDVLILIEGVHQAIPDEPLASQPIYLAPPVPAPDLQASAAQVAGGTDADKLRSQYKVIGDAQNHKFGEGGVGEKPANFNLKVAQPVGQAIPPANKPGQPPAGQSSPASGAQPPVPAQRATPAPAKPGQPPALPSDDVAQRPHSE